MKLILVWVQFLWWFFKKDKKRQKKRKKRKWGGCQPFPNTSKGVQTSLPFLLSEGEILVLESCFFYYLSAIFYDFKKRGSCPIGYMPKERLAFVIEWNTSQQVWFLNTYTSMYSTLPFLPNLQRIHRFNNTHTMHPCRAKSYAYSPLRGINYLSMVVSEEFFVLEHNTPKKPRQKI